MHGLAVLRHRRQRHIPLPVLMLTAADTVEQRVKGLDLGADDYMAKPFALTELEARVRALTRRSAGAGHHAAQVQAAQFRPERAPGASRRHSANIGRASCRERGCPAV